MRDLDDVAAQAAARRLFDERELLPLEARAAIVEAMSRVEGREGLVEEELGRLGSLAEDRRPALLAALRLALFGVERGEIDPGTALRLGEAAVQRDPRSVEARSGLARAFAALGRDEEALEELAAVIEIDPARLHSGAMLLRMGALNYNLQRYEAALRCYREAAKLSPEALAAVLMADSLRMLGRDEEARRQYLAGLRRQPMLLEAMRGYRALASQRSRGRRGELAKARVAFEALGLEDVSVRPWRLRRLLLSLLLRRRRARGLARRMLAWRFRRHPEQPEIHFSLGLLALLGGSFELAADLLSFTDETEPRGDSVAASMAALCKALAGCEEEAARQIATLHKRALLGIPDARGMRPDTDAVRWTLELLPELEPRLGSRAEIAPFLRSLPRTSIRSSETKLPDFTVSGSRLAPELALASVGLRVDFDEGARALVAGGPLRVGIPYRDEIRLTVAGEGEAGRRLNARIGVYARGDTINVRWLGGDRLMLWSGKPLEASYVTIPIGETEGRLLRGADFRQALAAILVWR